MHHRMNPKVYPNILKALGMKNVAARERLLVSIISNRTEAHDAVAAHWTAVHAQHPTSKANAIRQIFAAARFKPLLQKPQTPVLLVCGQGDRLVSPARKGTAVGVPRSLFAGNTGCPWRSAR